MNTKSSLCRLPSVSWGEHSFWRGLISLDISMALSTAVLPELLGFKAHPCPSGLESAPGPQTMVNREDTLQTEARGPATPQSISGVLM